MSTVAQIAANQQNAELSLGPVTEEGKAISSQNNFRHGLASGQVLIPGEDPAQYDALLQRYVDEYQPTTPTESTLVSGLAQHQWVADRAFQLQSLCFTGPAVDEKQLGLYIRYETTHRRHYHKCLNQLLSARKEKRQEQIGFESQKTQQAESARRQEMHEAKVRLTHSRAQETEIASDIRQTIEAPLPGNLRIPFDALKSVFEAAVREVAKA